MVYKYNCSCGWYELFNVYSIYLEGTLTFRKYVGQCSKCLKEIDTMDIHEDDLIDQEYLC